MRTRFYKVTITDGHLTKCVVIPAKNLKGAKSELQKDHTKVTAVTFFGGIWWTYSWDQKVCIFVPT